MESPGSVRVHVDQSSDSDDIATLTWPPSDPVGTPMVPAEPVRGAGSHSPAASPPSVPDARRRERVQSTETAGTGPTPQRGRVGRIAVCALAAVAIVEGIVLVLQFTRNESLSQLAAMQDEPTGPPNTAATGSGTQRANLPASPSAAASITRSTPAAGATSESGGPLQVQTDRPGAVVFVDGRRSGTAPLTLDGLSLGPHRVRLVAGDRSVEQTVVMQPGVATTLVMPMAQGPAAAGWVDIDVPFEVHIFERGELVGTSAQRRLQFPAGEHRFELVNEEIGYRATEIVKVRAGEMTHARPEVPTGLLNVNAIPWAEVWIDGRDAGTTPLGNLPVALGAHEVRFHHPELGEQTRRVLVTSTEPARVSLVFGQ